VSQMSPRATGGTPRGAGTDELASKAAARKHGHLLLSG